MTYRELIDFLNEHGIDFELMHDFPNSVWLKFDLIEEESKS